ncbi:hypothetical protein B0H17DRAFT_646028 [Mycena rosella]|uniref:Uncharacterized protein n=1 Tax=Mycena rosella TaxID=1033263 RepID=A0AAD7DDT1_MYCRO|nr:hypothetical protein B0H17DRAFT_646028 [Mycena rosella]
MLSIVTAALIGTLLELFLFGVYAVLFTAVIYLFRSRHGSLPTNKPALWVLLGLVTQFLTITAHCIVTIYKLFLGAAAAEFYLDLSTPSSVTSIALLVLSSLVTDTLVIYRLYVIGSHRRKLIIFPLAFLVGQAVSAGGVIHRFVEMRPGDHSSSDGWVATNLALSIVISVYSTAMISWKIWRISTVVNKLSEHIDGGMRNTSILAILIESAALQTSAAIGTLVTFQLGFVGQAVWAGIMPVIFGLATVLIHSRIGLGWSHESDRQIASNPTRIHFVENDGLQVEHELEDRHRK